MKKTKGLGKGWYKDYLRHSLASRGIKSSHKRVSPMDVEKRAKIGFLQRALTQNSNDIMMAIKNKDKRKVEFYVKRRNAIITAMGGVDATLKTARTIPTSVSNEEWLYGDFDGDEALNYKDCYPLDPRRQDTRFENVDKKRTPSDEFREGEHLLNIDFVGVKEMEDKRIRKAIEEHAPKKKKWQPEYKGKMPHLHSKKNWRSFYQKKREERREGFEHVKEVGNAKTFLEEVNRAKALKKQRQASGFYSNVGFANPYIQRNDDIKRLEIKHKVTHKAGTWYV